MEESKMEESKMEGSRFLLWGGFALLLLSAPFFAIGTLSILDGVWEIGHTSLAEIELDESYIRSESAPFVFMVDIGNILSVVGFIFLVVGAIGRAYGK